MHYKKYKRHYLQYNDFVFDEYDMLSEDDASSSFRQPTTSYSFTHGSYAPYKRKGVTVNSGSVSLTLILRMNKLPCDKRKYYIRFIKSELAKQGRLWAVQDGSVVWAYAYMTNYSEGQEQGGTLEIDVSFDIPEGVWHKANKLRTFLEPFDVCDFMDCYHFKDVDECEDCCQCEKKPDPCDCCCESLTKDMALCNYKNLDFFYECTNPYKLIYDCLAAERLFGNYYETPHLGQRFCSDCGNPIAGILYSDTDIPTEGIRITIHGEMHNPYIEINGNGNTIEGDYEGTLVINPDGSVYNYIDDCKYCDPLPADVWKIPGGMNYGWTVEQGNNSLLIDTGGCCDACAYIEVDSLTY